MCIYLATLFTCLAIFGCCFTVLVLLFAPPATLCLLPILLYYQIRKLQGKDPLTGKGCICKKRAIKSRKYLAASNKDTKNHKCNVKVECECPKKQKNKSRRFAFKKFRKFKNRRQRQVDRVPSPKKITKYNKENRYTIKDKPEKRRIVKTRSKGINLRVHNRSKDKQVAAKLDERKDNIRQGYSKDITQNNKVINHLLTKTLAAVKEAKKNNKLAEKSTSVDGKNIHVYCCKERPKVVEESTSVDEKHTKKYGVERSTSVYINIPKIIREEFIPKNSIEETSEPTSEAEIELERKESVIKLVDRDSTEESSAKEDRQIEEKVTGEERTETSSVEDVPIPYRQNYSNDREKYSIKGGLIKFSKRLRRQINS